MDNFVVIAIIVAILALVILYIVKAKKSGIKCIGCPDAKTCQSRAGGCSSCNGGCQGCNGCSINKETE